jgi:hypothetical protein
MRRTATTPARAPAGLRPSSAQVRAFLSAGNPPGRFPLDNISGTIYAAGPRADFENAMFGDANLAVIASCIFVDGGVVPPGLPAADFEFNPGGGNDIAGVDEALTQ